jgi:hypothetical protein
MDILPTSTAGTLALAPSANAGVGAGLGVGGLVGGGLLGLIVGSMLGNNGGGLFGGNRNGPSTEGVALGALEFMEQAGDIKLAIANAGGLGVAAAGENRVTTLEQTGALATALAAGNFTTLSSINGLGRDVTSGQNQIQLQTLNAFNGVNTSLLQGFNSAQANAFRDATAIQTTLQQQNMVQAECCCQIKQAISVDGQATRALINDIRLAELQSELADTKNSLSNANQTLVFDGKLNAMATTIITHLMPRVDSVTGVVRTA